MSHGFDLDSPLVCEGIVGDGCGGGRIFFVKNDTLFAYDPLSKVKIELLADVKEVQSISKKRCIISLYMKESIVEFDLTTLH